MLSPEAEAEFISRLEIMGEDEVRDKMARGIFNQEKCAIAKRWLEKLTALKEQASSVLLVIPRAEAEQKTQAQVDEGEQIKNHAEGGREELEAARDERSFWTDKNKRLLGEIFADDSNVREYAREERQGERNHENYGMIPPTVDEQIKNFHTVMDALIGHLKDTLVIIDYAAEQEEAVTPMTGDNYVNPSRLDSLRSISSSGFDLSKLICLFFR